MQDIKKHLLDNEEILWQSKPGDKIFSKYDILTIPLTLILFGGISLLFTLFLITQIKINPAIGFYFLICGLLIYVISFFFIFGRFPYRKKRRKTTRYLLTNKRALIFEDNGDDYESCILEKAMPKAVGKDIYFTEKNTSSEIFYNLGLDVFIKNKPQKVFVFFAQENPSEILDLIKNKVEGDMS